MRKADLEEYCKNPHKEAAKAKQSGAIWGSWKLRSSAFSSEEPSANQR